MLQSDEESLSRRECFGNGYGLQEFHRILSIAFFNPRAVKINELVDLVCSRLQSC